MRLITSSDLPQADRLESVLLTLGAIADGAHSDIEIANRIPGIKGDDRQGRYYRNAAEMLGFISNHKNYAVLTHKGKELLKNLSLNNPLFIASVLNLEVYQKLLPFIELHEEGVFRHEIQNFLQSIADPGMGTSMIPRRISTIIAWPKTLGFLSQNPNGRLHIKNNLSKDVPVFEIHDEDQPLLPTTGDLTEYREIEQRRLRAQHAVTYLKDLAKLERANSAHIELVNLVSQRIRQNGGIPKSNQLIDLAVRLDEDYIFEMKSTHEFNVRFQVRKGMSQLYEYRYLQNKPEAKLILVIEKPLEANHTWMLDFLETDRGINIVWDGNNELYGSERTRRELKFLQLRSR